MTKWMFFLTQADTDECLHLDLDLLSLPETFNACLEAADKPLIKKQVTVKTKTKTETTEDLYAIHANQYHDHIENRIPALLIEEKPGHLTLILN